jgi:aminopeptidase N
MKTFFLLLLIAYSNIVISQIDPPFSIDITKYTFDIKVNESNDSITGLATIIGKSTGYNNLLILDLVNLNRYKKGMKVLSVTDAKGKKTKYTHVNDQLKIQLSKKNVENFAFHIKYIGVPQNGLIISKNKFGDKTWFGDNWPNRARYWLPCVDQPNDKAMVTWKVTAPSQYTIVANGLNVSLKTIGKLTTAVFEQKEPIPTKVAVIGIAKLEASCEKLNEMDICNLMYPQSFEKQPNKMQVAKEVLTFLQETIGPYPYQKLYNIQSTTIFAGMENANTIFYDEYAIDGLESNEGLIAHEITHQWFGNSVTEKDFSHLWLSEGFATFFTHYYLEKKYGVDTLQKRLTNDRKYVENFLSKNKKPMVLKTNDYMQLLNANSYQKGGLFLQALREKVGDTVFLQIIKQYYNTYKFSNVDTDDFKNVVESITKTDYTAFFKDWIYSTSLPAEK